MDANSDIINDVFDDEVHYDADTETESETEAEEDIKTITNEIDSSEAKDDEVDIDTFIDKSESESKNEQNTEDEDEVDEPSEFTPISDTIMDSDDDDPIKSNKTDKLTVIDAYIRERGQLIILISGLSATNKTKIARTMKIDFNIKMINEDKYYKKDYSEETELILRDNEGTITDSMKIINYDNDESIDWDALNKDVESNKKFGLVVCGMAFPTDKLTFVPDLHIHIKISKQNCLERRREFILEHKDDEKLKKEYDIVKRNLDTYKMNKITYPYYMDMINRSTISRFINGNDLDYNKLYDISFETVIEFVKKYLKQ
jgi:hypothetical protein